MEASQQAQAHNPISHNNTITIQDPDFFPFLKINEEKRHPKYPSFFSENGLSQDIVQVTQAEPDIPLEVFYALYNTLWPQIDKNPDISFKDAWTRFIGGSVFKGTLCPPEKLITERKIKDIKRSLSEPEGEARLFHDLDGVVNSILNLKQKIDNHLGDILYKEEIKASLTLIQEFYQDYRSKVKGLVQDIFEKEKINAPYGLESDALEDLLEPKAIIMSDIFTHHWAYRISRSQAQKILSLDMHGRNLKSNLNDPANHRVIALPEKSDNPLVFFKANGNPPIQPEKEFILYSLYRHLHIPVPETALLVLTDVFEANPDYFYAIQASEAVIGESPLRATQDPETVFDHEAYVSQTIGAFLTNPSDGSFKNFKYSPIYHTLISIDNDLVFKPELNGKNEKKIVNVRSILYLLPQIDNPIPESVQTFFTTLDPHLLTFAWLQDLSQKNREYQLLFARLGFQKTRCIYQNLLPQSEVPSLSTCLQQIVQVDCDLHGDSFKPQIFISPNLLMTLIEKIQQTEKILLNSRSVSTQTLFEEISPILGKYYRKLRFEFSDLEEALEALWGIKKNDVDYSYVSSLLDHEDFSNSLNRKNEFSENLPPETFFMEYKNLATSGSIPIDRFIRRHLQRKKKNALNLQVTLKELQFLIQEGLINSQSIREIVDFCHTLSKMIDCDPNLIKEIIFLLSNLPHPELKWLLALEKHFFRADCLIPKDLMSSSTPVLGAFMKKRTFILTESDSQYLFDQHRNIRTNANLTGRSSVTCFPQEKPEFYLKQYPEWPGYEFASTLFMRLIGIQHLPFQDLLIINSKYPALLTQKVHGDPVLRIWHNPQAFHNLDPFHTTLLIISAMLINPEDGKEDNFILSPDGRYLIPIDNDHCFLPSTFQKEGSFWNGFTVNTALQTKTLLFCLAEMDMPIPLEVRQHIISLNFDQLLTNWMTELDRIENKIKNLVGQHHRNQFLQQGTVMRIPFYKQFIQSLYWKAHKIQNILSATSKITPFGLLKAVEPFAARCYQDSFQEGNNLQTRFRAATANLYKNTAIDGSRVSILNTRAMMDVINVSVEDLQNDVIYQKMGPVDALELLNKLIKEHHQKTQEEQEMLCELDEKNHEQKWTSLFGNPPGETVLKAFLANHKEGLILKGSKLATISKLTELFAQAPDRGMRIRFLSLLESPLLTEKEIKILAEECPNIEYLNVSGCLRLKQLITKNREWPLLARLEAKGCLNLEKFVSYSPVKILQIQSDSKIEIFVEKPTLDIFTISKKKSEFEFSLRKGRNLEIKSQSQTLPNKDFLLRVIRGKESVESFFRYWNIIMKVPLILFENILKNFITFLDLGNVNIKAQDIQRMVLLNLINLNGLNLSQNGIMATNNLEYLIQWPKLNHLDLSQNQISIEGVEILSRGNWPFLEFFNISNTNMTSWGAQVLANRAQWPRLKHLDISENQIYDEGLEMLCQADWSLLETNWPLLETLNLQNTQVAMEGVRAMVRKHSWPKLKYLNFSNNKTNDETFSVLCQGNWPLLETLQLKDIEITKKTLSSLLLNSNWPNFKEISLSADWNDAHQKMVECFIKKDLSQLEGLDLNYFQKTLAEIEPVIEKNQYKCPQLKHLKILENDPSFEEKISMLVKTECPLLEELHLENTKLSLKGVKVIVNQSKWLNLKHLNVSNNEILDEIASAFAFFGEWPLLENLNLSNTKLSVKGVEAIVTQSRWLQLKSLDISQNEIFDEGLSVLTLVDWPLIEEMNLNNTKITSEGIERFMKKTKLLNLKKLNISQNEICNEGFEIFARKDWPLLEDLNLRKTSITTKSIEILINNKLKWPNLKRINVSHNPIQNKGLDIIASSNWNHLECLYLEKAEITNQGIEILISKSHWPNLKVLDISENEIGDQGLITLSSGKWPLLESLYLRKLNITGKGVINMTKISTVKLLDLSENKIWTEPFSISFQDWHLLESEFEEHRHPRIRYWGCVVWKSKALQRNSFPGAHFQRNDYG